MKYSRPRGTQDVVPPDVYRWLDVEAVFGATMARYGYEPIRTPVFESTDLFLRSVGEGTDIVSKEMYTFTDRGGRSLTLRPENTAAVIRAYLENGMHRIGGIVRLSYVGPMFRYDRPQAGRYRQFHQVGAEAIGSGSPMVDAEIIDVIVTSLEALGFRDLAVQINSVGCKKCRGPYRDLLSKALQAQGDRLCEDCRERAATNPLRVFDCKRCQDIKRTLPPISEHLCAECRSHFESVKSLLAAIGRPFTEDPQLVRGLDYYTRTTFEILHRSLGAQNALCGGGRYDDLVEECGGPPTPAVGFSAGLERIISVLPESPERTPPARTDVYVACVGEGAAARAMRAAGVLRRRFQVELDASQRSLKTQLRGAEKKGARATVIVEGAEGAFIWKDMTSREQFEVMEGDLMEFTSRKLHPGGEVE